jgi:hypothetical protein
VQENGGGDLFFHAAHLDINIDEPEKSQRVSFVIGRT